MKQNLTAGIMHQLRLNKQMQEIRVTIDKGEFLKMAVSDKYPFSYTIGLYQLYKHPEILIFTASPLEEFLSVIQTLAENVENGFEYKDGETYDGIVKNYPIMFRAIDRKYYSDYLGTAIGFYKSKSFPALHCLFPDEEGRFPFQVGCNKVWKDLQTLRIDKKRGR